ncbi:DUF6338 family protein [Kribbella sp. NPDC000426]|uniref:DUF6338 family protein n=1 Tax=Kribbella sp. NPDC000426 TaxID=3154255 RepID=UPI00332A2258
MLPTALPALLIAVALVPGWLNRRLLSRFRPPTSGAGALSELIEIVAIGLATTGVSLLAVALVPLPFTLDVGEWATCGSDYLAKHARAAIGTVALSLVLATALSVGLHFVQRRRSRPEFRPEGNVWVHALGTRSRGTLPWVGLKLTDGRLVEGRLHSYSLDDLGDQRDVALAKPIRITDAVGKPPRWVSIDRLIMPFRKIDHIVVIEGPEAKQ